MTCAGGVIKISMYIYSIIMIYINSWHNNNPKVLDVEKLKQDSTEVCYLLYNGENN